ncbi:glycogen/starch synthase [Bradyrhizobium sp.]|uniref:glycogen/starch synthase n=1 Tax=Bradyrhizobium sp. TaxID=376 RepID=UPI00341ADA2D
MKVLFVTPEIDDFIRVGGLAAVSAALPRALRLWSDVRVLVPGYHQMSRSVEVSDVEFNRDGAVRFLSRGGHHEPQ